MSVGRLPHNARLPSLEKLNVQRKVSADFETPTYRNLGHIANARQGSERMRFTPIMNTEAKKLALLFFVSYSAMGIQIHSISP